MTHILAEDVHHLARLSQLQLDDAEVSALQSELEGILTYIDTLSEINTDDVEPTYQVTGLENVWVDDEVDTYGLDRNDLIDMAPDATDNQVKVPKVL